MKIIGSQYREPLSTSGMRLVKTWPEVDKGYVVLEDESGKRELWLEHDDHAGYTIEIEGIGYEFARSLPSAIWHS